MDKSFKKQEEKAPRVEKLSKESLALVDISCVFVVQQGEATTYNQKIAKLMNRITKGLGAIDSASSGGSTKATIKVRLSNSFTRKETKTKRVQPWLHQVEEYMKTQHLETDKEQIHFVQILLKEHGWEWLIS
jgi:hypothetical protein